MKKLKGKCRTCFGCNILDEPGFKGRKKCKNYIRANPNEYLEWLIIGISVISVLIGIGFYLYCKINMLAGG